MALGFLLVSDNRHERSTMLLVEEFVPPNILEPRMVANRFGSLAAQPG